MNENKVRKPHRQRSGCTPRFLAAMYEKSEKLPLTCFDPPLTGSKVDATFWHTIFVSAATSSSLFSYQTDECPVSPLPRVFFTDVFMVNEPELAIFSGFFIDDDYGIP